MVRWRPRSRHASCAASAELERLRAEVAVLTRETRTDPLTGLLNRRGLLASITESDRGPRLVVAVDLDGLKAVNDAHGHATGDALIARAAAELLAAAGPEAIVARLGGDEFTLVLREADPRLAMRRLRARLMVRASIGIVRWTSGELSDVLSQADSAMYADKQSRRRSVPKFETNRSENVTRGATCATLAS